MANRVPLIVDSSTLYIKELPLGDALDLTGCSLVGVTSFTRSSGFEFSGITTFSSLIDINAGGQANTFKVEDLTDNQIVIAGSGGELEGDANFTFTGALFNVGVGATFAHSNVSGTSTITTLAVTGIGTAETFQVGDLGLKVVGLTTLSSTLHADGNVDIGGDVDLNDTTQSSSTTTGALKVDGGVGIVKNLNVGGNAKVDGNLDIVGSLNYTNVTDIQSVGIITAGKSIQVGAGLSVVGVSTFVGVATFASGVVVTGISTFEGNIKLDGSKVQLDEGQHVEWKSGSTNRVRIHGDSGDNFIIENDAANDEVIRVDTSGRLIVGSGAHGGGTQVVIKGGGVNSYSTLGMYSEHTNPTRGTVLSQIRFGSNATADGADIRSIADGDWATNDYPARIEFHTVPDGSSSRAARMTISGIGSVGIGVTNGQEQFVVGGRADASVQIAGSDGNSGEARLFMGGSNINQKKCAIIFDPAGGYCRGNLKFCMENGGDLSNVDSTDVKMTLSSAGKLGIGTVTPRAGLDIDGTAGLMVGMVGTLPTWGNYTGHFGEKLSVWQGRSFSNACFNVDVDNAQTFLGHNVYYDSAWKAKKANFKPLQLRLHHDDGLILYSGTSSGSDDQNTSLTKIFQINTSGEIVEGGGSSGDFNVGISSLVYSPVSSAMISAKSFAAGKTYIVESIHVSNVGVGNAYISGDQAFSGGKQVPFANKIIVPFEGAVELLEQPIIANASDIIKMQAFSGIGTGAGGLNGSLEAFITYSEKTANSDWIGVGATVAQVTSGVGYGQTIYTSTSKPTVVQSVRLVNNSDVSNVDASISIFRGSGASKIRKGYLVKNISVPMNSTVEICSKSKYLDIGDIILADASAANALNVFVSGRKKNT